MVNAAKCAPDSSRTDMTGRVDAQWDALSVGEDSLGIPTKAQGRVFDMLNRLAEGDGQRAGTDVDVATACGIIEDHCRARA